MEKREPELVECLNCRGKGRIGRAVCDFCGGKGCLPDESRGWQPPSRRKPRHGRGWRTDEDGVFWVRLDPGCREELASRESARRAAESLAEERLRDLQDLQKKYQGTMEYRINRALRGLRLRIPRRGWR